MAVRRPRKPVAGRSALAEFRRLRRATIRRDWHDWARLALGVAVMGAGLLVLDGWVQILWAIVLGALLAIGLVGWMVGGDVSSLTWVRGAAGEQQTEHVLHRLPETWYVAHDLADGRANWDHVVVGPPGVFVVETKSYSAPSVVENDTLRSGGLQTRGARFRGSAVRLKELLEAETGRRTWVTAVVAVWGDLEQSGHTERDVVYLKADQLTDWLTTRPPKLSPFVLRELVDALGRQKAR